MHSSPFAHLFQGSEHQPFHYDGGQPGAVLVHGFPGTPAEMLPLGQALHQAGWTVHGLLLPGFGVQLETLMKRKHTEWVGALQLAYRAMSRCHDPVILVGFSLGAALVLQVAAFDPPAGVILLAPFYTLNGLLWATLPVTRYLFPTFRPFRMFKLDFTNPEMRRGMQEFMPGADLDDPAVQQAIRDFEIPVSVFAEIRQVGLEAARAARRLRIPALIMQGSQDALVKPEQTRRLMQRFAVPPRYHEVPAAHDLPDPSKPAWSQVVAEMLQFADEIIRLS